MRKRAGSGNKINQAWVMELKIGLIGAMQEEIEQILQDMEQSETVVKAGLSFYTGRYLDKPVVLVKCGVGKVNAAVCTQILIDRFEVERVIFTGVAGALHPELNIGDIVVSSDCMQHDMDASALGFDRGIIPYEAVSVFQADAQLVRLAGEACQAAGSRSHVGRVLSGDQFIADKAQVAELHEQLSGSCTEMEGAAVAQVCSMNGVPFVVIRSMSDKADGSAHMNFAEFTKLASRNSSRIIAEMMKRL